jgi:SPP1 gp7 family putative phage head morphogenesis protein
MKKAGYDVPTLEETGGIDMVMRNPNHREMLLLLYARMVGNMKGLTDAMKVSILNILAQGLATNDSPEELVKKLSAIIPLARAATIARDAVIMAFAEGQLTEFESWGVTQVGIEAEVIWQTIGDEKVCTRCHAMEGKVFTISEARGKIPLHSHCRCSWVLVKS